MTGWCVTENFNETIASPSPSRYWRSRGRRSSPRCHLCFYYAFCVTLFLLETLYVVWKFDEASFVKDGIAVDRANLFSTRLGDQLCFFNAWAKLIAKALIKLNQAKWFHPCSFTSPCSGTRTLCSLEACC